MAESKELVAQWQAAYRGYTAAHEASRYAASDDPTVAAGIAPTYRRVARLWRQLAADEGASWWAKAAALHAAEIFDHQAELNDQIANKEHGVEPAYAPAAHELRNGGGQS